MHDREIENLWRLAMEAIYDARQRFRLPPATFGCRKRGEMGSVPFFIEMTVKSQDSN